MQRANIDVHLIQYMQHDNGDAIRCTSKKLACIALQSKPNLDCTLELAIYFSFDNHPREVEVKQFLDGSQTTNVLYQCQHSR